MRIDVLNFQCRFCRTVVTFFSVFDGCRFRFASPFRVPIKKIQLSPQIIFFKNFFIYLFFCLYQSFYQTLRQVETKYVPFKRYDDLYDIIVKWSNCQEKKSNVRMHKDTYCIFLDSPTPPSVDLMTIKIYVKMPQMLQNYKLPQAGLRIETYGWFKTGYAATLLKSCYQMKLGRS